jgi:hypothetical protein
LEEAQLEEYIIDRGQSKQNYFLYYKNEIPHRPTATPANNPLKSELFLKQLHAQVAEAERRQEREEVEEDETEEGEGDRGREGKEEREREREREDGEKCGKE